MFEISLDSFIRIVTVGVLAYIGLILFLRISGKRTLTKLNAFDLVVSVALGSTLATILLDSSISLFEGLTAFAVLIFMQYIIAIGSVYFSWFNDLIKSEPKLLYLEGRFLRKAMKEERIKEIEILQAMRSSGMGDTEKVKAVVLETDGSMSIISSEPKDALANVNSPDQKLTAPD
ncbi:DUF421 domain-containing protein [Planococcus salinus]|uniref:DUF421 domain-containing protein n=1 Tax=Planococcus salinus TaxID=1848460 RepID=A0A3M8P8S6_9BACL|nr:YetF domain-containing protein [Planococcus salinus]RNF39660.1 DUF421 domain-containing protein [Planococcus salinus]